MKFTCLCQGGGFNFPPCHILNVSGFQVLFDCPLDLSALTVFSPLPNDFYKAICEENSDSQNRQKVEKPLDANDLIFAEPCPMGMLGLPFLTRMEGFSAKIYITEAAARIGQLMMEELICMNMEYRQFYGAEESSGPQWMKWEELELLPSALRKIALGEDGSELGGWMPLYSAAHVTDCISKVQTLRFGEEACYNGILIIKAFSSGLDMGACNWIISGAKGNIAYISGSNFASGHAMDFDYRAIQGSDLILYSDLSSLDSTEDIDQSSFSDDNNNWEELINSLSNYDESVEEMEKLAFICSCAIDSVKAGGSVLIPINRVGVFLQLLEQIAIFMECSSLKIPIYIISSVAEELLAYTNTIPEWLCKQRQEKLFSGDPLFAHVKLIKEKKIHVFPAVHSPKLLMNWQEPCIVFSPHWSLRLGPTIHLLRRWSGDHNSLLVLENEVDAELAVLPFKPISMKVLQCSFLSGKKLQKVQPLLKILQPKLVLFPEELRTHVSFSDVTSFSVSHYSENETIHIPSLKESAELEIAADIASKFQWRMLKQKKMNITRLKGRLFVNHGKHQLLPENEPGGSSQTRPFLHWGSPDPENLLAELSKMGINGSVERCMTDAESEDGFTVKVQDPEKSMIEVRAAVTVISAADKNLASPIVKAMENILEGI
ncbi:integrator complex subunit 9 homolog isoform X2 [Citrus clementina]|uniref:integrator complex subunit 9 homolog isoform X2 n=1 Tax=Citrus clementina TaxID=85681 RepID=UPI000CED7453|nr:integrator complex subunit 9 homolog isoform X2 [Citrus x clementina]